MMKKSVVVVAAGGWWGAATGLRRLSWCWWRVAPAPVAAGGWDVGYAENLRG